MYIFYTGKRDVDFGSTFGRLGLDQGKCEPMRKEGDICSPRQTHTNIFGLKDIHSFACPCAANLECKAEKIIDLGFGHAHLNAKCTASTGTTGGSGEEN